MMNFLNANLNPSIKCNAVLDDTYLPENLLSNDSQKNSLGFMAYHVTKPPIDLTFELICPINLYCIKIWSKMNSLKSTSFEIGIKSINANEIEFIKIGNCYNLLDNENGVTFINQNHNYANDLHYDENLIKFPKDFRSVTFFNGYNYRKLLQNTKMIKVSIKSTLSSCVPVIKKIEIWGHPSKHNSELLNNKVLQKWYQFNNTNLSNTQTTITEKYIENHNLDKNFVKLDADDAVDDEKEKFHIPEEYLDSITYEVMQIPMVLPCGKTVDMITFNKHNTIEESWGRQPSDPFTGQLYTGQRKAVFDSALKSRIDQFLLKNANQQEIIALPRISGVKSSYSLCSSNEMVNNKKIKLSLNNYNDISSAASTVDDSTQANTNTTSTNYYKDITYWKDTTKSLDKAIESALQNINRFSKLSKSENMFNGNCFKCLSTDFRTFYEITNCSHLLCRNCLLNSNSINNCPCGYDFSNINVNKYHIPFFNKRKFE